MSGHLIMAGAASDHGRKDPPKISISEEDARKLTGQYGDRGTLPKHLPREERKAVYEARYVSTGGHKRDKHQRRADRADKVTAAATGGIGASAAAELLGRAKPSKYGNLRKPAVIAGLSSTALGAGSELTRRRQQRKAKALQSTPNGVAAGALRRMQDYEPAAKAMLTRDAKILLSRPGNVLEEQHGVPVTSLNRADRKSHKINLQHRRDVRRKHGTGGPLAERGNKNHMQSRKTWLGEMKDRESWKALDSAHRFEERTRRELAKADSWTGSIKTSISNEEAKALVAQHGKIGTLPKNLDRETRMKVYEARYIAGGGKKRDRAQRTSVVAGGAARLGGAALVGGSLGYMYYGGQQERAVTLRDMAEDMGDRRGAAHMESAAQRLNRPAKIAGRTALGGAALAAGGGYIRAKSNKRVRRNQSMASGTAAGALRRMQRYSEE